METIPSYIQDTIDFLKKRMSIKDLPKGVLLFRMNITSFYNNIPQDEEGMEACIETLDCRQNKNPPIEDLACKLMKLILEHKGAIIFFRIGGHEKAGGHRIFSWEIGGSPKKSRDYWVTTNFNENLFNEIAHKMHIFRATRIGGYMFLQHCSPGGGGVHKIFDHQIGGHKNIAEVLSEIHDPLFQRKWWTPNSFSFNGIHYRQLSGTKIGTRMAPFFVNLQMIYLWAV